MSRTVGIRLHDLRRGMELGYPLCCVLTFVLDPGHRGEGQALRRGVVDLGTRPDGSAHRYVACMFHRRRHPAWRNARLPTRGALLKRQAQVEARIAELRAVTEQRRFTHLEIREADAMLELRMRLGQLLRAR